MAKAKILDSTYKLPALVNLKRSDNNIRITLHSDTLEKDFMLKSGLNKSFTLYNLLWFDAAPIAYLVDLSSSKKYEYANWAYLDVNNPDNVIRPPFQKACHNIFSSTVENKKGQLNAFISFPWVNSFYQQPMNESPKSNTGFWGIAGGAEYYYKKNRYICFSYSAVMDLFVPVPAAVDIWGEHQAMSSSYLTLNDNFKMNRISLGYGLNYSRTSWNLLDIEQPVTQPLASSSKYTTTCAFGITLNSYYQLSRFFYLGITYRPTLLNVYPKTELKYQHLISLDLMWKFRIKK
jgi:hypothetical protein